MGNFFKRKITKPFKSIAGYIYLIISIIMLILFNLGIDSIGMKSLYYRQDSLSNALRKDIAQCYAIEGFYPPSLEYIREHYGLSYDEEVFFIDYSAFGSNIYPDVTILNIQTGVASTIR
ncbi:hypothetical protein [Butyrivibrio sp. MC2013]|uniref:hypothetical protein n=1 Tax=Butyrivibrio sp. MC2013 TaxID=1280686 RepID=UPI000427F1A5|nr:hypothetical protein [Butyrivibrio sp. MC2013]